MDERSVNVKRIVLSKNARFAYEVSVLSADGPAVLLTCKDRTSANAIASLIINDVIDVSCV
jgi:hypothetical protein